MKKINFKNKLTLTKEALSKLDLKNVKGGDDFLVAGMSIIGNNTVYYGCGANLDIVNDEHMTKRKCSTLL
jgi:hypothetical protein